ncbi:MAG: hypothetical protein M3436_18515 [Pseudomonadota bacterium]|nr:hypothetical protein [Pseudomonadota bacterium]
MNALSNLSSTSARVVIRWWPWLLVLVWVAGLAGVPALAQDANEIATGAAPVGRLPKGFTEKSAKVNGVRINYQVGDMLSLLAAERDILSHDLGGAPSVALAYMASGRALSLATIETPFYRAYGVLPRYVEHLSRC